MTKREELNLFIKRIDEFIDGKYILADVKIINILKVIAGSETLLALFKNCLTDFDYSEAKKTYLVKSKYLSEEKGEFILPPNSRELLAFIFNILVEIDAKTINFGDFLNKYFYVDGSYSASFESFKNLMIKPFKNSVKVLMESVIEGKLQDPLEAVLEEEKKRADKEKLAKELEEKEKELSKKTYFKNIKAIKDILLKNKMDIKNSKLSGDKKQEMVLVIDMLANAVESDDKDAIRYAFISYKYVAKVYFFRFFNKVNKIAKLLKDVLNAI